MPTYSSTPHCTRLASLFFLSSLSTLIPSAFANTTVSLFMGDSSIGESDILLNGNLVASVIAVDATATTYDVACTATTSIAFPFTTPACVGREHVTITQGPNTMILSQVFVTESYSVNLTESCSFSNTETMHCSILKAISETVVVAGKTITTDYSEGITQVAEGPSNKPLYFAVAITAGAEKLAVISSTSTGSKATVTGSGDATRASVTSTSTSSSASGSATGKTSSGGKMVVSNRLMGVLGLMLLM